LLPKGEIFDGVIFVGGVWGHGPPEILKN